MEWEKLGVIYNSSGKNGWDKYGAFLPTTLLMGDVIRIYCSMHDENQVGRVGYVDVDAEDPLNILDVSCKPVFDIGELGCFDDNGVTPASVLVLPNGDIVLYYVGWQLGVKVRYYLFSGVALSLDAGESFTRLSRVPVLDRTHEQAYLRTAPSIFKSDTSFYHLFYVGGSEWIEIGDKLVPKYSMYQRRSYVSYNAFSCESLVMEPNMSDDEFGFGRPQVIYEDNIYKMFYSIRYRTKGYRLGYAEARSINGPWVRKDELMNLDVSEYGWDSSTVSFGHVVDYKDKRYIFYNGTEGQPGHHAGIGCAVLK